MEEMLEACLRFLTPKTVDGFFNLLSAVRTKFGCKKINKLMNFTCFSYLKDHEAEIIFVSHPAGFSFGY